MMYERGEVRDEGQSVSDEEGKVSEQWGWMKVAVCERKGEG